MLHVSTAYLWACPIAYVAPVHKSHGRYVLLEAAKLTQEVSVATDVELRLRFVQQARILRSLPDAWHADTVQANAE